MHPAKNDLNGVYQTASCYLQYFIGSKNKTPARPPPEAHYVYLNKPSIYDLMSWMM